MRSNHDCIRILGYSFPGSADISRLLFRRVMCMCIGDMILTIYILFRVQWHGYDGTQLDWDSGVRTLKHDFSAAT